MAIHVGVTGTPELQRALAAAGVRASEGAVAALYQEAERVMAKSKQEAPVGVDGVLRASGYVEIPKRTGPFGWLVTLGYGGAAKSYAAAVHEGRRPGSMPPSLELIPWVKKKLGVPTDRLASVAYLVARKIARVGTAPTKFLEKPLLAAVPGMASRMAATIRRRVERK